MNFDILMLINNFFYKGDLWVKLLNLGKILGLGFSGIQGNLL